MTTTKADTQPAAKTPAAKRRRPTRKWIDEFAQQWLGAWNSHDPDRLLALMTEDIVYDDSAWPTTMRGHAQVREFLDHAWRGMPDMRFELREGPFIHPD